MKGWVYIATNESLVGMCKIGFSSKDPALRVQELHTTGVPTPFKLTYSCLLEHGAMLEHELHDALRMKRVSAEREFFSVTPMEAVISLRNIVEKKGLRLLYVEELLFKGAEDKASAAEKCWAAPAPRPKSWRYNRARQTLTHLPSGRVFTSDEFAYDSNGVPGFAIGDASLPFAAWDEAEIC